MQEKKTNAEYKQPAEDDLFREDAVLAQDRNSNDVIFTDENA
ncbi:MAG: hypothetical protein ACJATN_002356 [Neolewinella sp.]